MSEGTTSVGAAYCRVRALGPMQGSGNCDISVFGLSIDTLCGMERMSTCISSETQHVVQSTGTLGTSDPICP